MYSCKLWNKILAPTFLQDVGVLSTPQNCTSSVTIDIIGIKKYRALVHWRRSNVFVHVGTAKFRLSKTNSARKSEVSCLVRFFASLPIDILHLREVQFFLNDRKQGVDDSLLLDMLSNVHRSGCKFFRIYSSRPVKLRHLTEDKNTFHHFQMPSSSKTQLTPVCGSLLFSVHLRRD